MWKEILIDDPAHMTPPLPSRVCEYNGPITRGARWDSYRPRPGDIIISAPQKSGMTWTQAICAMLIFGRPDLDVQPARVSPWFDSNFEPLGSMLQRLEAQTHRRYLKTHTPLDGLPYYPEVSYLAVFRHPLDVFNSMASLTLKMAGGNMQSRARLPAGGGSARGSVRTPPDIRSFIMACVRAPFTPGVGEQMSVSAVTHYFMGFWTYRHLSNIHLIHYADMKRDLKSSIRAIASALGIAVEDAMALAMAETSGFANMQANAQQYAPESYSGWGNPREFFQGGTGGQWKNVLNESDVAEYRRAYAAAIRDRTAADWLENGNG